MRNKIIIPEAVISDKVYLIRNQKMMLDRNLASLCKVETKALSQIAKKNLTFFPVDFMVSQSVIPSQQIFGDSESREQIGFKPKRE